MRLFLTLTAVALAAWAAGFFGYVRSLPRESTRPAPAEQLQADGIVVLTGGGGARISAGMLLFEHGVGTRMLVSGVHRGTTKADIVKLWTGDTARFDCCVDLGWTARSTEGNAVEIAEWTHKHGYRRLIVVTTDNHMPRAMVEIRARLPDTELAPYPVRSDAAPEEGWMRSATAWRVLATEYTKYLVAEARTRIIRHA